MLPEKLNIYTLWCGYAVHDGDWNWKDVRSPFARLYYVTEGEAQVMLNTTSVPQTLTLTAGHLYFIPPFTTHSDICTGHFEHFYIHIYENPDEGSCTLEQYDFPFELPASPLDRGLFERLCRTNPFLSLPASNPSAYDNHATLVSNIRANLSRPLADKVESRGILYVLLSAFFRQATPRVTGGDDRIQHSLSYIRHHLGDKLSIDELAREACLSKDHFIRLFRQETGETPAQCVIMRRMEMAEMLLVTTDMPVKAIADRLGFSDPSYFCRTFRRVIGITPQQYRENL